MHAAVATLRVWGEKGNVLGAYDFGLNAQFQTIADSLGFPMDQGQEGFVFFFGICDALGSFFGSPREKLAIGTRELSIFFVYFFLLGLVEEFGIYSSLRNCK